MCIAQIHYTNEIGDTVSSGWEINNELTHGNMIYYHNNGIIESILPYNLDTLKGVSQDFDSAGRIKQLTTYKALGNKHGAEVRFYPTGSPQAIWHNFEHHPKGSGFAYYPNGGLKRYFFVSETPGEISFVVTYENGLVTEVVGDPIVIMETVNETYQSGAALSISVRLPNPPNFTREGSLRMMDENGRFNSVQSLAFSEDTDTVKVDHILQASGSKQFQILFRLISVHDSNEVYEYTHDFPAIKVD